MCSADGGVYECVTIDADVAECVEYVDGWMIVVVFYGFGEATESRVAVESVGWD